jgi:hypothetical protein
MPVDSGEDEHGPGGWPESRQEVDPEDKREEDEIPHAPTLLLAAYPIRSLCLLEVTRSKSTVMPTMLRTSASCGNHLEGPEVLLEAASQGLAVVFRQWSRNGDDGGSAQ